MWTCFGIFDHPIGSIIDSLTVPGNWCDIISLIPILKLAPIGRGTDVRQLTFCMADARPIRLLTNAHQFICRYRIIEQQREISPYRLDADNGPLGTREHRLPVLRPLPLDAHRTFIR